MKTIQIYEIFVNDENGRTLAKMLDIAGNQTQ